MLNTRVITATLATVYVNVIEIVILINTFTGVQGFGQKRFIYGGLTMRTFIRRALVAIEPY
jgi:hypothetical protein